jgi:hypothetical protein
LFHYTFNTREEKEEINNDNHNNKRDQPFTRQQGTLREVRQSVQPPTIYREELEK